GRADDPERHQPAPLRDAQGDHGGEEEGDPESGRARRIRAEAEDRQSLRARESEEDAAHSRVAGGSGERARPQAARGSAGGPVILVVAEQRDGKLNRATWETIAAAQQLAGVSGAPIAIAVPGASTAAVAGELAAAQVKEVVTVEHPALEPY